MPRHRKPRRGALLLIVLSILVLFLLIALTYVIIATRHRSTAESFAHKERTGDHPRKLLDGAIYQIVRDTNNPLSVVQGHSLLRDLNGDDYVIGDIRSVDQVTVPEADASRQFITFVFVPSPPNLFRSVPDYYNGAVLTFLQGPAKGHSTRVVGYNPGRNRITIEAFDSDSTDLAQLIAANANRVFLGRPFLINGRPFNGTGFGYNPAPASLNLDATDDPNNLVALMPNFGAYTKNGIVLDTNGDPILVTDISGNSIPLTVNAGGADESWDAVDYQNMLLAMVPPGAAISAHIIPSLHRPALINYWMNQASWSDPNFRRRVIMRPMPWDHLNFSGSNPALAPGRTDAEYQAALLNGPWDVDNDADGVPDSIWVDLGYPIQTAPDGRRYKPLFAPLCQDLDGRLNVNAHGNLQQLLAEYTSPSVSGPYAGGAGGLNPIDNPQRGLGVGPADIYLGNLFGPEYQNILHGRYGEPNGTPLPGLPMFDDWLSRFRNVGLPVNYMNNSGSYGSPPDTRGLGVVALDYAGHPWTRFMGQAGETVDDPYELNLSSHAAEGTGQFYVDTPYTLSELERLLRMGDIDASALPDRLRAMAPAFFANAANRRLITTRSMHIPVPNVRIPPALRSAATPGAPHISDIVIAKFNAHGVMDDAFIKSQLSILLPFEILHGQKMNLNRLWGNGQDDAPTNGVVDEPGEGNETIWPAGAPGGFDGIRMDYANNDPIATAAIMDNPALAGQIARQTYARHLYCLMMLVVDKDYLDQNTALTARRIAQWAINVVDFRDADTIMTPFEYDPNPFNGWDVDGDLTTTGEAERSVVWGCERPELLITEMVAFHARRTEDTTNEFPDDMLGGGMGTKTDDMNDPDLDFDQRLQPKGAFFVELYNPWSTLESVPGDRAPAEFYHDNNGIRQRGVLLHKRVAPGGSPVWRLIVVKGDSHTQGRDPDDDFSPLLTRFDTNDIDRSVYFTDPATLPAVIQAGTSYGTTLPVAPLMPGRYAVVGSAGRLIDGEHVTTVGRNLNADDQVDLMIGETRRLVISPNADPSVNQFEVRSNGATPPTPPEPALTDIHRIIAVAINRRDDQPASLSISEPPGGYPVLDPEGNPLVSTTVPDDQEYEKPYDEPFDNNRADLVPADVLQREGTLRNFRTVHLQRLANPLLDWDPAANPYRTIDSMSVDLTVFNGVTNDPEPPGIVTETVEFETLQRGDRDLPVSNRYLWKHEPHKDELLDLMTTDQDRNPKLSTETQQEETAEHFFPYILQHTLGYLNHSYIPRFTNADSPDPFYKGSPNTLGVNRQAFPWLTWLNRPFASHLELTLVPKSRSSRLLFDYTIRTGALNPYTNPENDFGHLLNFSYNSSTSGDKPAHFYRLLDYVEVPSRFVGTEKWYNPTHFNSTASTSPAAADTFRPPFNRLSRLRDPGRVNINTIFDPVVPSVSPVWRGIAHAFPSMDTNIFWDKLVESREGFNGQSANNFPTRFANPFRSAASADLMPLPAMRRNGVEATLLRPDPDMPNEPLFGFTSGLAHDNTQRNPYFRYQGLQRLGNLLTTHSNVYAVWITVGFFEIDPVTQQLGQELGSETGEVKRHRGFYIIDRSIPVAFEPGKNHNVDRVIVLRRFIE